MLKSFLIISARKLMKHGVFSFINVAGLTLGITSCVLILIYVGYEKSFDDFRPADIYRVVQRGYMHNVEQGKSAQVVPALPLALNNDLPEVVDACRLVHTAPLMADPVIQVGDKSFRENRIYFADPTFLQLMNYSMLSGRADHAIDGPNQVVISSSTAKKYFGKQDPINQTMILHKGERGISELKVTAVFEDVPQNSHLHTDFIISFSTLGFNLDEDWDWGNFYAYIKLTPGATPELVESKIPSVLDKYLGESIALWAKEGYTFKYFLQPIRSIHLDSHLWAEAEPNGDRDQVNFLAIIAIVILIIAWVNYINFAIANSSEHVKEIGIRKISGSSRFQLIGQQLTDAMLINVIAAGFSIALIQAVLPLLNQLFSLPALTLQGIHWLWLSGFFVTGTLLSGAYPALLTSRHKPVALLTSRIPTGGFGSRLNRSLVMFQFSVSIILIISTLVIQRQLSFMHEQDLGLNISSVLVVKGPATKDSLYAGQLDFFRNQVRQIKGVEAMAVTSSVPGQELHWGRSFHMMDDPANAVGIYIVAIDENFFDLFQASFSAGGNFKDGSLLNQDAVIINETAARALGFNDPSEIVDKTIIWQESDNNHQPKRVVGVVKDFNQQSLKANVEPMIFALKKFLRAPWAGEYYAFKLSGGAGAPAIAQIKDQWNSVFPGNPFDYFFQDDYFARQYENENAFGGVFKLFAGLAIMISCMGLFGLSYHVTIKRIKEIGIRKVLGSTELGIIALLSKDFVRWVAMAYVIACPLAWYGADTWLQNFAFRIDITPGIFIYAGIISLLISLVTVSWRSAWAARRNPSESLRYE
ncbi:MAG: ABC transporter permease [Cyclobacteriaceae bacterium]